MAAILEKIPSMKMGETVSLWQNAIRILANPKKSGTQKLANQVIEAIGAEWDRRRSKGTFAGDNFSWPSTEADFGSGGLNTEGWVKEGVLKYMGYKVGNDGESQPIREHILSQVFLGALPPVSSLAYMDEWSRPQSAARLQKLAETIAALTRNAKRERVFKKRDAVRDWENDLKYLYYEYYVAKFHFAWPDSSPV